MGEGEEPRDLDIHLVQVETKEPRELCQTYWNNMAGCPDTELDQNLGEQLGSHAARIEILDASAETITVAHLAAKDHLRFLVFVDDNTATGADLSLVQPQVTMAQGTKVVSAQMPSLPSTEIGSRFWSVGAIEVVGSSFRFVPSTNTWSIDSPWTKAAILVDNLLDTEPIVIPSFCEGIQLNVTAIDALTHAGAANSKATVIRLGEDEDQAVIASIVVDANGKASVPITEGGQYDVQVEASGYISASQSIFVECAPEDCAVCAPSIKVPLSPVLGDKQLRLTLGGEQSVNNMDLYAVFRDTDGITCETTPDKDTDCTGVDQVTGAGDKGVQTITFNQLADDTPAVYTIFVEWNAPAGQKETLAETKARVTLTDGTITEEIQMKTSKYGGERNWWAGCLIVQKPKKSSDHGFTLKPLNAFLTKRPDVEMPDHCLEAFNLQPKGIEWKGQCTIDKRSRVLPVDFGRSKYNTPAYCIAKCKSHKYKYAAVEYSNECFCGNASPEEDLIVADKECNKKCPGDNKQICGGTWRMNTYATGYQDGMPLPPGHSCDCDYTLGGCKISRAPPAGYSCKCKYKGWWSCRGQLRLCGRNEECPAKCKSKTCCKKGQGDCGGYWW